MHRWTTRTFRSLVGIPDDIELWQTLAPKDALKFDFLMDGILALSALDIAVSPCAVDVSVYVQAALQYYEQASGQYRWQLSNLTKENHQAVFLFGLLAVAINLVIPHCVSDGVEQTSTLDHVLVAFDLLHGISAITLSCWDWLKDGPITFPLEEFRRNPLHLLDDNTKKSIKRLHAVNEAHRIPNGQGLAKTSDATRQLFKNCIINLEFLFAKEIEDEIRCICTAFPGLCGKEFTSAVAESNPMALFILMHWGVLLARLGHDAWWARPAGKNLVAELSVSLALLQNDYTPEWEEGILWARSEAGLQDLAQMVGVSILV
ncbi:hypothetical protein B0A52_10248 [Exophiala mesophila]|uniref:Transcription factor domain-containing protein n=1 Tax=Exophiala mesophila TaxID=212818 RepID=A0A438MQI9_EXOME|nr:hypothetical protein B0A52_10248 [Exophiala mesophila]